MFYAMTETFERKRKISAILESKSLKVRKISFTNPCRFSIYFFISGTGHNYVIT